MTRITQAISMFLAAGVLVGAGATAVHVAGSHVPPDQIATAGVVVDTDGEGDGEGDGGVFDWE